MGLCPHVYTVLRQELVSADGSNIFILFPMTG
jgi:hypothetical protein